MSIALVTSIYGDYDQLVDPPEQVGDVEYVAVVDRVHDGVERWRQVVEVRDHIHPRLAAKVAKCRPDHYTDADVTVWVDGSVRVKTAGFARWAASYVHDDEIAQFPHPDRHDVAAEANLSLQMPKYHGLPLRDQVAWYRAMGLPRPSGLWATGVIVRGQFDGFAEFGDGWLAEQMRWSWQDQISEPWILDLFGLSPAPLDGNLWRNEHVRFADHAHAL